MLRLPQSYAVALLLLLAAVAWMASGIVWPAEDDDPPQQAGIADAPPTRVQTLESRAESVERSLVTQANVLPSHQAQVRAETSGRVVSIEAREGSRISEGDLIVRLSLQARESKLAQARASLRQYEAELAGARRLAEKEFTPRQRVRELEAQVAAAQAEIEVIEQEIADASIGAPFSGVLNDIAVEPGEYVSIGAEVATMIENDPLWARAQVSQQTIGRIEMNSIATVTFATGAVARGRVCFISAAAMPETRTFAVEVRVPNPGNAIPSGISAEVRIPTGEVEAHKISPAILSLGPEGELGVKTVRDNLVRFHPIEIAMSSSDGVWVTGLPQEARIITVGQGFVRHGDAVEVASKTPPATEKPAPEAPSATTAQAVEEKSAPRGTPKAETGEPVPPCVTGEMPEGAQAEASRQ